MAIGFNTSSTGIGLQPTLNGDAGLNQPTLTLEQSQSVSEQTATGPIAYTPPIFSQCQVNQNLTTSAATGYAGVGLNPNAGGTGINFAATTGLTPSSSGTFTAPTAANLPGVGSLNEDSGTATPSSIAQQLNVSSAAIGAITPQANVLDQYASYTYSLSLYLITADQFNALKEGPPNFSTWSLLMQSGGAGPAASTGATSGRNPFFSLDYYMDNLVLESRIHGGGTGLAHNVAHLSFTVSEPNGITLPSALAGATNSMYKQQNIVATDGNTPGYASVDYVMVIRFYGYDDNGNLVQAGTKGSQSTSLPPNFVGPPLPTSADYGAFVTKYYPFKISKFEFRLATKGIEYTIHGAPQGYWLGASAKRGTIPTTINLVGKTVADVLNGNHSTGTKVSPTDGRNSSNTVKTPPPAPSITQQVLSGANPADAAASMNVNYMMGGGGG